MRKFLLFSSAALMGVASAMALPTAPQVLPLRNITKMSPDGRYMVVEESGSMAITDLETGKDYIYTGYAEDDQEQYTSGNGRAWSGNGIMVGCTTTYGTPDYWQNGEWKSLPNPENRTIYLTGINTDGTMICGTASVIPSDNYPGDLLIVPVYWTLNDNGEWSDPQYLPFPELDFTGRTNMYVYAHVISADGKTIFGHTKDYSGFRTFPIVYELGEDGKWSYRTVADDLVNPSKYEFPECPSEDELPEYPEPTNYMNAEQLEDYNDAMANYRENGWDPELYPEAYDYITDEMWAKYLEDKEAYDNAAKIYNEKLDAFYDLFNKALDETPNFMMNIIYMDDNGTMGVMSQSHKIYEDPTDPMSPYTDYISPMVFDLKNDTHTLASIDGYDKLNITAMTTDGVMLASGDNLGATAFIKFPGKDWVKLYDFLKANTTEETGKWMEENLVHTFSFIDYLAGTTQEYKDYPMIGRACCSDNLGLFASCIDTAWDLDDEIYTYGYLIPTTYASGVKLTAADSALKVKAMAGGVIAVSECADIEVFDMQGRRVFNANNAVGDIATGLEAGFYTVKATSGDSTTVVKARF
ncbi:MAG: T9SS type A sorting domain-containing protein [Muribaculaceae bacterium]|nr:T9SS type A sorting domain-containing protein [Muribaculaceae bacterium]MDE6447347.1 T9SS type A sorting domain-containing protein [Muribaculaceae bacterium]